MTIPRSSFMSNGWTGGQYSVVRAVLGVYVLARFLPLISLDPSVVSTSVVGLIGASASIALLVGRHDRVAAIGLVIVWTSVFVRAPLLDHLGPIAVVALLILHGLAPPSPFGSWDARGRVDPGSGWRLPPTVYATTWFLMVLGVVHAGLAAVVPPPSVVASLLTAAAIIATLLLWPRMRRSLWVALLGVQLAALAFIDARGLNAGLFLLQPFTFDPSWIAARISNRGSERDHTVIYYDGSCGLCHRTVRFLLAEDAAGSRFRYAPLDSESFRSALLESTSGFHSGDAIPDSVVVHRPGMPMLTRAAGALEIGEQLGGLWRLIAVVVGWLPMRVSNGGYDFIARVRHRIFKRPADACPLLPAELRARFLP